MSANEWIVRLDDRDAAGWGKSCIGGKAANLGRLMRLGLPVPRGFTIADAARVAHASEPARVWNTIAEAYRALDRRPVIVRSSAAGEDSAAASFAGQLDTIADVRDEAQLRRALIACWASRESPRVRSYERSRSVALGGMGVIVQEQIAAAISGVLFTRAPNVGQLRDTGGADLKVHRKTRGADGASDGMLVEYCAGAGEALVSGRVNPGRIALARTGGAWTILAAPEESDPTLPDAAIAALAAIGREIEDAFGAPQDIEWTIDAAGQLWIVQARPITTDRGAGLKACATGTSKGRARVAQGFRLRQSSGGLAGALAEAVNPVHARPANPQTIWSNANVNENFPRPISPLLYSVASAGYYHYFRNLGRAFGLSRRRLAGIDRPLRQIIGVHGARMYYNLTSIHHVLRAAPFGEHLARAFNGFVGSSDVAPRHAGQGFAARRASIVAQAAEVIWMGLNTTWQYLFLTRRVCRFERTVDEFASATDPRHLATRPLLELRDDLRAFMEIRCQRWKDASLADAASMVCYGILQRLLAASFPGAAQDALHNTLLKALPGLVSSLPPIELWKLSRTIRDDARLAERFAHGTPEEVLDAIGSRPEFSAFKRAFDEYLERWGFRCSAELMLTSPSFQEDPAPLVGILRSYVEAEGESPTDQLARQEAERERETARVLQHVRGTRLVRWLPFVSMRLPVRVVLAWTQRSIQLRERARLKQALLYSRLRRIALAIGERLADDGRLKTREDVFFLTIDEIDALLSGSAMFPHHVPQLVALRAGAHAQLSAMQPPDSLTLDEGEYVPLVSTAASRTATASTPVMQGTGACGGRVSARATVIADVTESHALRSGDVLVTRQTDPGWGPVFPLISGLVIERGGMLSHGAIIAREFGIPSVVGVRDATRLIPSGSVVSIDGDKGLVEILAQGV